MYSFINCTCHQILLELWKEVRWMSGWCTVCVTWDVRTGLSEILNHNGWSYALLGAYMYTKLQTRWHVLCCYGWLHLLSHTWQHICYSNTINISTVVMLGFLLCHFNTGILTWRLFLSSSSKFFLWLFQFNICSFGYGWWCLWFEFLWVSFVPFYDW